MAFTLRQIEIFVEAAKDENFRKTADRLGISQPSISKHIIALERSAGGRLFLRNRGANARISPLGEEMLADAKALLRTAGKVSDSGQQEDKKGLTLRIATGHYLLDNWLRPRLRGLLATEGLPSLEFIEADDRDDIRMLLRSDEADYGFYTGDPLEMPEFTTRILRSVHVGLYAAPALAASVKHVPQGVAALPFILSNKGTKAEAWQRSVLAAASIQPAKVPMRTQYMDVMFDLVNSGRGAGIFFDDDAEPFVKTGQLVRFPIDLEPGTRCMATVTKAQSDPKKDRAITMLCDILSGNRH